MAVAWVGDDGAGGFWAHVDYDGPGPFCLLNGPGPARVEEAVAWARSRAPKVYVRVGGELYSAGQEPVRGLLPWLWAAPVAPAASARQERPRAWRVEARTGWYRPDRESGASRLAGAVARDPRASDAKAVARERGFMVSCRVSAASELDANELAFDIVGSAWAALEIEAVPGDEFDISGITVHAL